MLKTALYSATISIGEVKPSQCKGFSCSIDELDEYLKRYAKVNEKRGISRNFVSLDESGDVVGFYTLCMAQINFSEIPFQFQNGLPKYPIPAARLCRLAVHQSMQGRRLGEHLLMDAIERVLAADKVVAAYTIVVDAKSQKAVDFYQRYGFISMQDQSLKLFLPFSTFRAL